MPCRACRSDKVRQLRGELTATWPSLEELKVSPIYVSEDVIVCLDCGFAELVIPQGALKELEKMDAAASS